MLKGISVLFEHIDFFFNFTSVHLFTLFFFLILYFPLICSLSLLLSQESSDYILGQNIR